MHILHVTAHLGGGVGKAHAALRAAMPAGIRQTYLLLEEPRDRRYADEIASQGGDIVFARNLAEVASLCAAADIVQFEFWNHPKLFECLARADFPPLRSVFWAHISGLFRPVIAPGLMTAADRFVFTTPASLVLGDALDEARRARLSSIGSGFGFAASGGGDDAGESDIAYLGTVDFIKMHQGFFAAIDALKHDAVASIWGAYEHDGEVAAKTKTMRHADRVRFMGQTADPQTALNQSAIFFYPLQPDHYGTAENALIEAMSLGLVPVVLANPAECAIIEHGVTGFIGATIGECTEILDMLLASPETVREIGGNAAALIARRYTAGRSAAAFVTLWQDLLQAPKCQPKFADILGQTPLDWYLASQYLPGEIRDPVNDSGKLSKGTLSHFRSAFPDHPCWAELFSP